MNRAYVLSIATRPVWFGDDDMLRIGHSGDMIQMLEDLGVSTRA